MAGKIVLLIRKTPRPTDRQNPFGGKLSTYYASLANKIETADKHKVAGILMVNDRDTASSSDRLMEFGYASMSDTASDVPVFHLSRSVADTMLQSSLGKTLRQLEEEIDADLKPRSAPLTGWIVDMTATVKRDTIQAKNIIGVLEGAGPLAKEYVILGAHYDHLGFGGMGSLATGLTKPAIHHGADDNGSGTTMVLEMARRFAKVPDRQGRTLIFMTFSGEESGLIGSSYYCKHPLFPLADTVAMVNVDMVGEDYAPDSKYAKRQSLSCTARGSSKTFDSLLELFSEKFQFHFSKVPTGMGPGDQQPFYEKNIPVLFYFTDTHSGLSQAPRIPPTRSTSRE